MKRKLLALLLCTALVLIFAPQAVWATGTDATSDATYSDSLKVGSDPVAVGEATPSGLPEPFIEEGADAFLAETDGDTYTYVDEKGDAHTTDGIAVTPITAETATFSTGWYVVNGDVIRTSTITVSGDVTLILMDGFTLTVTGGSDNAGINVSPGNSLTVYGQAAGTGMLLVQGGGYGAGIGGGKFGSGGTITINSGTVTATGGYSAAGIGGGHYRPNGNVIIKGGTVTALGGSCGAGIGGGNYGSGGTIAISGGTVTATGGQNSAGIGGGEGASGSNNSNGGTITISGGSLTANGNGYGAGIGGGLQGSGGTISISSGCTVNATGGDRGAGIGGGYGKDGGRITISGGSVNARSTDSGAGIGGGALGSGGNIIISGGEVRATSTYRGAGIGGGDMAGSGSISIQNGTIIARAEYGGAGIGSGYLASANTIKILNGDITATGVIWGAGIGGGGSGSAGNITISGGTIRAYGGDYGAGIGAGGKNSANTHNGGTIQILGGKVTARGGASGMDAGLDIGRGRNGVNGTLLIDDAALVTLVANSIDSSVTTLGTCIIRGSASGALLGAYEDGTKLEGTLIDLSSPTLASGTGYTVSGSSVTLTGIASAFYILSDSTTTRNIKVSPGVSADVVLFSADIAPTSGCAFDMQGAEVNMTLIGANTLSSADGHAGLLVPAGAALQVTGSGSLMAQGGMNGAGIGGQNGVSAGSIAVYGGNIEALGSGGGAGIGGGNGGDGGTVTLDGTNTVVSATGGMSGYDVGSGNGSASGGQLEVDNGATLLLNRNGTNAAPSYITCTLGGEGAGLKTGSYVDSYKLLTYGDVDISPASGAQALDTVALRVEVEGLSDVEPEGYISFLSDGAEIGQANIIRTGVESSDGAAEFLWTAFGGTHAITAKYAQNASGDSYINTQSAQIAPAYTISRIAQTPLAIEDPGTLTYGDAPFSLSASGGSGTGGLSFTLKSGDAVSVTTAGQVTIIKAGTATIAATKAADANYEEAKAEIEISVNKAIPPALAFPSSSGITYGAKLFASALLGGSGDGTFAWKNPDTVPMVLNSGYPVIFTPRDADNYDYADFTLERIVGISVSKAVPTVTFPTAEAIVYGDHLSSSVLAGGSGDGTFDWKNPDTAPMVLNSGYPVVFTPSDTENYRTVEQIVEIHVEKAEQAALSIAGIPSAVRYGGASFTLDVSGGSGTGAISYAVTSGDSIEVDSEGKVSILRPGAATLTITKAGDSNYYLRQQNVLINVGKGLQTALMISGIPEHITYGDKDFTISVSGGSGTGAIRYVVTGDAVRVDASGRVYILRSGLVILTAIKAGDELYDETAVSVGIQVSSKTSEGTRSTPAPTVSPANTLQPTPPKASDPPFGAVFSPQTPTPAISGAPVPSDIPSGGVSPTPHDRSREETSTELPTETILTPAQIKEELSTGKIVVQVSVADLPEGADAIQLANGERIAIDRTQDTIQIEIGPDELNAQGELELFAIKGQTPISLLKVSVHNQLVSGLVAAPTLPVLAWVAVGIVAAGLAGTVGIIALKKHKQRF